MKVLVFGGRDYPDKDKVYKALNDRKDHITCIIQGGATGADEHARLWAQEQGLFPMTFAVTKSMWKLHGKPAGPRRNQAMVDFGEPDYAIAFPGGRGTASMTVICKKAGINIIVIE